MRSCDWAARVTAPQATCLSGRDQTRRALPFASPQPELTNKRRALGAATSDRRAELLYANEMEMQKSTWTRGSLSLQQQPDGLSTRRLCFCSQWQTYSRLIRSVRLMRMASVREQLSDRHIQAEYSPSIQRHPHQNRSLTNAVRVR